MNLRSIDLNLLVMFDALMTERSVTGAARKVGISQSAMSHPLGRLRDSFHDDLIRRTPNGMVPTARALELAGRIREILRDIEHALDSGFDPASSERSFRLGVTDYLTGCLLPPLSARIHAEAPKVILSCGSLPLDYRADDVADVQLRVCVETPVAEGYMHRQLYRDRFVVAMNSAHPAARKKMDLDLFLSLPQLRVDYGAVGTNLIDRTLERRGVRRNVVLTVPNLQGVLQTILQSELCAVLPEMWIAFYMDPAPFALRTLPVPEISLTVDEVWQTRHSRHPAQRWLRRLIEEEFQRLHQDSMPRAQRATRSPRRAGAL